MNGSCGSRTSYATRMSPSSFFSRAQSTSTFPFFSIREIDRWLIERHPWPVCLLESLLGENAKGRDATRHGTMTNRATRSARRSTVRPSSHKPSLSAALPTPWNNSNNNLSPMTGPIDNLSLGTRFNSTSASWRKKKIRGIGLRAWMTLARAVLYSAVFRSFNAFAEILLSDISDFLFFIVVRWRTGFVWFLTEIRPFAYSFDLGVVSIKL